jgi:Tol biopolymer transport system component
VSFLGSLCLPAAYGRTHLQAPVDSATPAIVGPAPELFAPGIISSPANDGSPTFAPDGNTLYFTRSAAGWGVILESHNKNGVWTEPEVAPFSGVWPDSSPGMAPDGSYLVFVSIRPKSAVTPGEKSTARMANLYRVNRVGTGWSEPERLPDTVNIGPSIWKPSVAPNGTIYFVAIDAQGGKRLYSAEFKNGAYQQAQPLSFSDGTTADVDPEIAPDGSFLLFCSSGRTKGDAKDHLYIALKQGADWGAVLPMHYAGDGASTDDEPHLGPDRKSIYFSSDRAATVSFPRTHEQAVRDLKRLELWDNSNSNVWFMPLAPWLNAR